MNYLTIARAVKADLTVKKSRFVCIMAPVQDNNDLAKELSAIRIAYPGANHYCYACITRQDGQVLERCSDDGEPSGTAGRPILGVLKSEGLQNVLAVVVRYFGGTLLGTGGLVRAYSGAAQAVLDAAQFTIMEYSQKLLISIDYSYYGGFQKQFNGILNRLEDAEFLDRVYLTLWLAFEDIPPFTDQLANLTGGTAGVEEMEKGYYRKTV